MSGERLPLALTMSVSRTALTLTVSASDFSLTHTHVSAHERERATPNIYKKLFRRLWRCLNAYQSGKKLFSSVAIIL